MTVTFNDKFIKKLSESIQKSVSETSSSVGVLTFCNLKSTENDFCDAVICSIDITGAFDAHLNVIFPFKTASQYVSKMVGDTYAEIDENVLDGCRELTNMIAGGMQVGLSKEIKGINIGLPKSWIGHTVHVRFSAKDKYFHQKYSSTDGDFDIYLVYHPERAKGRAKRAAAYWFK